MEAVSQEGSAVGQADAGESLAEDEVIDIITNRPAKLRGNEEVRQRIARALTQEYGISREDMERDFPIQVNRDGQRRATKKADIAIFERGTKHPSIICAAWSSASRSRRPAGP